KALGDRVGAPRFVATVHRRGYRFIAGVTDSDPRPERDEASERSPVGSGPTSCCRYRGPAHFVGREPALDRLQRGIEAAWRGTRQIVFVTGEPGIGKTGVVEAFLERATVGLVSLLARRQEPARLLLIGTYRPVDVGSQHPLKDVRLELQARGRCQELSLELLSEAAVADYLRERFAGHVFPSELVRVINRRTEGNPLVMVSVVEDLVARGLIVMRDERWELRAVLEEVEVSVPESLRQMIERRMGQLEEDERQVLAAGSVAGMEFSAASVAAALQRAPAEMEESCDELAHRHR